MKRHRPEVLARAETSFHCKDWLYFKLTGERATDPSEANFTFGEYLTRNYAPHILDELGAGDAKRLLPPIVEGTVEADRLSDGRRQLPGLRQAHPCALAMSMSSAPVLGGGLFDREGKTGCTIVGSTGMHMRIAPSRRRGSPQ